jgi:hypothetical protein
MKMENNMSRSEGKSNQDLIQVHWSTIFFEVRDHRIRGGLKDFELLELDQIPDAPQYTASVQFSAETSAATAIRSLQQIIEKIEKTGLPETTRKMPREYGARLMKLQRILGEASDAVEKLHPDLRDWYSSLMERAGEPGFSEYLKELSEKLGISESDAEEEDEDDE